MKKLAILMLLIPGAVLAQAPVQAPAPTPASPLSIGSKTVYSLIANYVTQAAEQMPEENYSFKPTPDVRTFGQLIGHVADAQYTFCSTVAGDGTKPPGIEKTKTSKADLVQALKDAVAYCNQVYASMTDARGAELVKFFGREMPKLTVLDINTAHTDEHYGNIVTYMRLKGLTPPSSQGH